MSKLSWLKKPLPHLSHGARHGVIKRFPDDFMFQLTKEEWNILKSQIATAKQSDNQSNGILKSQNATSSWGGTRKLPYAFTREGIGMLSSVLGADTAIEMNIRIMRV